MGMAREAEEAASQAKDSDELFGRLKITLAQSSAAASIFDTLRDRLSFQGAYWSTWLCCRPGCAPWCFEQIGLLFVFLLCCMYEDLTSVWIDVHRNCRSQNSTARARVVHQWHFGFLGSRMRRPVSWTKKVARVIFCSEAPFGRPRVLTFELRNNNLNY